MKENTLAAMIILTAILCFSCKEEGVHPANYIRWVKMPCL